MPMIWAQTTSMYSNASIVASIVASRAKVAPFAHCLLGGSAPKPLLPDLAICGCGVLLRQTKCSTAASSEIKDASVPTNGENQRQHGGVVIVPYDHLCGDIDLLAECPG